MRITRRKFFAGAMTVGAGLAAGRVPGLTRGAIAHAASARDSGVPPAAVLYDLTQCAGCHLCEIACQMNKGLTPDIALLSFRKGEPAPAEKRAWAVRRHQCMHCLSPACVSACPVAAMRKMPEGPVIYDDKRCLGCRYCMTACPFNVPAFDWDSGLLDAALIRKCNFCYERQKEGKRPACIEACPTGAVAFGTRDAMLAEAKKRIKEHPDRYVDRIYGATEAGGTSFLLLSGIPFERLNLPEPGHASLTELPDTIMGGVLPFALGWTVCLSGIAWLVRLREQRGKGDRP